MEVLDRLEGAIERLIEQNRQLKSEKASLQTEKLQWQQDRHHLVGEIDRILERLENVQLEES
ncbi:MAG: cell division protein ZapB [Deltaproteobacteria bacterium]|nr:MAG: cell division protein ZapB [Deltaproteobacteria bacterium]